MTKRTWLFFAGFALVALVIAGALSYFADSDPDGLDAATLKGCEVVRTAQGEELTGSCIAQRATDHDLADEPARRLRRGRRRPVHRARRRGRGGGHAGRWRAGCSGCCASRAAPRPDEDMTKT